MPLDQDALRNNRQCCFLVHVVLQISFWLMLNLLFWWAGGSMRSALIGTTAATALMLAVIWFSTRPLCMTRTRDESHPPPSNS